MQFSFQIYPLESVNQSSVIDQAFWPLFTPKNFALLKTYRCKPLLTQRGPTYCAFEEMSWCLACLLSGEVAFQLQECFSKPCFSLKMLYVDVVIFELASPTGASVNPKQSFNQQVYQYWPNYCAIHFPAISQNDVRLLSQFSLSEIIFRFFSPVMSSTVICPGWPSDLNIYILYFLSKCWGVLLHPNGLWRSAVTGEPKELVNVKSCWAVLQTHQRLRRKFLRHLHVNVFKCTAFALRAVF